MSDLRSWNQLTNNPPKDFRIFKIKEDLWASSVRDYQQNFITLEAPNWVNIVAITKEHELICIKQWRAGTNTIELEIPGGMIDTTDSDPVQAGVRELLEETGYQGQNARLIGEIFPNPAIQNNTCFTVFVGQCEKVTNTSFDPGEEIQTELVPVKDIEKHILDGTIKHSLVAVALQHFLLQKDSLMHMQI